MNKSKLSKTQLDFVQFLPEVGSGVMRDAEEIAHRLLDALAQVESIQSEAEAFAHNLYDDTGKDGWTDSEIRRAKQMVLKARGG